MGRVARLALAAIAAWALAGAATASAAPVSVGMSGWSWGDPVPQGETLNSVAFQGARGYAAGEGGTVLRSDDGGASWIGLSSGSSSNLDLLQEVEPNTVVVGGGCTVRESTDGGTTFHRLPVNESEQGCATKVASFSFLNASTGYVEQADGSIFLTKDAGQTLEPKTSVPLAGATAGQIAFLSPTVGFALVNQGGGKIYRTTDGAGSWTQVAGSGQPLYGITFVTPTLAYAVGAGGTLLHSTDGGATWTALPLALPAGAPRPALLQISCTDAEHCLIATAAQPAPATNMLVRTTDGGQTGTLVSPADQNLLSVAFSTAGSAVAVGVGGETVLSSDGGATFPTSIAHRLGVQLGDVVRIGAGPEDAYVPAHSGVIAATTNGGVSWGVMRVPTSSTIEDVAFPTTATGYAVNEGGTVFKTSSGGLSWSILNSGGGTPSALLSPKEGTVVLVGPTGLRRSTNAGVSFGPVAGSVVLGKKHGKIQRRRLSAFPLFAGGETVGSAMIAWGDEAIESVDGGAHWALIPRPLKNGNIESLSFVSSTTGYAVSRQRVFFTRNAGRSWKEIDSMGRLALGGQGTIAFSSVNDGYALFAGGLNSVLRTSNAGRTWTPETVPRKAEALAAGGLVDYLLGERALFQTESGGLSQTSSTLSLSIVGPRKLSRKKLARAHGRIKLKGVLSPAQGGEQVTVAYRVAGRALWRERTLTAASNGAFSVSFGGISATTDFVAQWSGEGPVAGAGTAAVELRVTRH